MRRTGERRRAEAHQPETQGEDLARAHPPAWNGALGMNPRVDVTIESVVEKHAPDVKERQRPCEKSDRAPSESRAREDDPSEDVAPDGGQVGDPPEGEVGLEFHPDICSITHPSSREMASTMPSARKTWGSTSHVYVSTSRCVEMGRSRKMASTRRR